jgi:hypothetical protein
MCNLKRHSVPSSAPSGTLGPPSPGGPSIPTYQFALSPPSAYSPLMKAVPTDMETPRSRSPFQSSTHFSGHTVE